MSKRVDADAGPAIGDVPPPFQLGSTIQGPPAHEITWERLKGKVVVLEFWRTTCGPCVQVLPHFNDLAARFADRVVFISISDDNEDYLRRFLRENVISGWMALDGPLKATIAAYGVIGVPHAVIVDTSGIVAAVTHPAKIQPEHLEEVLNGRPSTLPPPVRFSRKELPYGGLVLHPLKAPESISLSIEGPFSSGDSDCAHSGWNECLNRFEAWKTPIADILASFFQVSPKLLANLPVGEELYDVEAAAPPEQQLGLEAEFICAAVQKCGIQITPIERELPVYAMTVLNRNAPALKSVQRRAGGGQTQGGFYLGGGPGKSIAWFLELSLDQPVVDETNLTGLWAAEVKWKMRESDFAENRPEPAAVIEAARSQLGLSLQLTKRRIRTLEVQRAEPGLFDSRLEN